MGERDGGKGWGKGMGERDGGKGWAVIGRLDFFRWESGEERARERRWRVHENHRRYSLLSQRTTFASISLCGKSVQYGYCQPLFIRYLGLLGHGAWGRGVVGRAVGGWW